MRYPARHGKHYATYWWTIFPVQISQITALQFFNLSSNIFVKGFLKIKELYTKSL